jgi:WD40 repeat protein
MLVTADACRWSPALMHVGGIGCGVRRGGQRTGVLWDVQSGEARTTTGDEPAAAVKGCAITPDDRLAVTARDNGTVGLVELPSGQEAAALSGHVGAVNACAAFPDAGPIRSTGSDQTCRIWDAGARAEIGVLSGHTDQVGHCAVSPDGSSSFPSRTTGRCGFGRAAPGRTGVS